MKLNTKLAGLSLTLGLLAASCGGSKNDISALKLFPVKSGENYQYIDQEGKVVINPQFSEATVFRNGLALVATSSEDPKWGFISEEGKFSIAPNYVAATVFSEDLAWVVSENSSPMAINAKGEIKITMKDAKKVHIFSEGLAAYSVENDGEIKWGFVDKTGKVKINPQFMNVGRLSNGLCAVQDSEGKWGYIDKDGKIVINFQFESVHRFKNGKAIVVSGHKYGVIDEKGKYLINPQFEEMYIDNDIFMIKQDNKWGWCDKEGKILINPQFNDAYPFNGNALAPIKSGNNYGYIDKEGKIVVNPQFGDALPFIGKLGIVSSNSKIGFVDSEGKYIINPQYEGVAQDLVNYVVNGTSQFESVETQYREEEVIEHSEQGYSSMVGSEAVMLGEWKGTMDDKKITIVIENVNGNKISGYNMVGTNKRPIQGTFTPGYWAVTCSSSFDAVLNEPGDDKWDGVFTISFVGYQDEDETDEGDLDCVGPLKGVEAQGTWKSNNGKLNREILMTKTK